MLSERFGGKIEEVILPQPEFKPFPDIDHRKEWESLPQEVKETLVKAGERHLGEKWPRATLQFYIQTALERSNDEYYLGLEKRKVLARLVTAECVENSGRFMNDIINGIWDFLDEFTWVCSYHVGQYKTAPDLVANPGEELIDHVAAEYCGLLSMVYYILGPRLDSISRNIRKRMKLELQRRITIPYLENTYWWMSAISNWNPWCHSNCLMTYLLVEDDEERRTLGIKKILKYMDIYINAYSPDGGCDEGPNYWTVGPACFFDALDLLYMASGGKLNLFDEHIVKEMGRFPYRTYISLHQPGSGYYVNFADAPTYLFTAEDVIFRFGKRTSEENSLGFGAFIMQSGFPDSINQSTGWLFRKLHTIFDYDDIKKTKPLEFPESEIWLDKLQVMTAREKGGGAGFFLAAKGGHNAENHNHNDVGQYIVYLDGTPVIVDMGTEEYKDKTFSSRRYEVPNMQSAYHNLPTVNGFMQKNGRQYAAKNAYYKNADGVVELTLDIADAYPAEAGIAAWRRTYRMNRSEGFIEIVEDYELAAETNDIAITMMIPCKYALSPDGIIKLSVKEGKDVNIAYDAAKVQVDVEKFTKPEDIRFTQMWGEKLYRFLYKPLESKKGDVLKFRIYLPGENQL